MSNILVKLTRNDEVRYIEWSTVVDAPVTYGMTRAELEEYLREEYGRDGLRSLPARLARCDEAGTSYIRCQSIDELVSCNRAGPGETRLTVDEIVEAYWSAPEREDHTTTKEPT